MKFLLLFAVTLVIVHGFPSEHFSQLQRNDFTGDIWAVLVAGSYGWDNYRHQADICHAYQILHKYGIPDDNIIVMMYDDIAYNEENPKKGFIRNRPNGPNVYPNVPKDYVGDDVTSENFLKVLLGDEELIKSGKKVLKSGPNDHVFVYFADHGAPGLIAFLEDDELDAATFNKALKKMYENKKYAKMVIYIEACESGSMFENLLPKNINIYATTAANSTESSWACYDDEELNNYLGDCYSVNWMENSDSSAYATESLKQQFKIVRQKTNTSHVQQFGDFKISKLPLTQFQGPKTSMSPENIEFSKHDAIPSPDVPLYTLAKKALSGNCDHCMEDFERMLAGRRYINATMVKVIEHLSEELNVDFDLLWNNKQSIEDHNCYMKLKSTFKRNCFNYLKHHYGLRFLYTLVNVCNVAEGSQSLILQADNALENVCFDRFNTELYGTIL